MPVEGNLIRRSWFLAYDKLPASPSRTKIVQSWDVAMMTGGQNDYSACTTWLTHKNDAYLLHVYRGRLEYPELRRKVIALAFRRREELRQDGAAVAVELACDRLPVISDNSCLCGRNRRGQGIVDERAFMPWPPS